MRDLFQYRKLTDFEKVCFLENQVLEQTKVIRNQGVIIGVLKSDIAELKDTRELPRKFSLLKEKSQTMEKRLAKLRKDYDELLTKYLKK